MNLSKGGIHMELLAYLVIAFIVIQVLTVNIFRVRTFRKYLNEVKRKRLSES
jgi:hypothetical protein